jgi:hypothetical protein
MKTSMIALALILTTLLSAAVTPEKPSDADFHAFKVYHHAGNNGKAGRRNKQAAPYYKITD